MPGQVWAVNSLGGYMYSDNLSKNLRMELMAITKFRQFCDVKDAAHQGKSKGDLFHWNVYSSVATQGGTIAETNTMPETNFTIRQGTLTITEYGNSVPYSGKLDDLSEHPVKEIINKVLRFDAGKAFDFAAFDQFNACKLRIGATATAALGTLDTAGTCATTNNIALSKSHIPLLVNEMKERNIPPYTGDDYYALGWPETFVTLKTGLEGVYQYTQTGFGRIVNGEIGRYQSVRFVEQTNCKKGGAADSTTYNKITTADAWNNAKSDWAFFFGSDTVGEGIAVPEQMRGKIPSDYGRSKGVALISAQLKSRELREHPTGTILSRAPAGEGATIIPFGSRTKQSEARDTGNSDDMISSVRQRAAA